MGILQVFPVGSPGLCTWAGSSLLPAEHSSVGWWPTTLAVPKISMGPAPGQQHQSV